MKRKLLPTGVAMPNAIASHGPWRLPSHGIQKLSTTPWDPAKCRRRSRQYHRSLFDGSSQICSILTPVLTEKKAAQTVKRLAAWVSLKARYLQISWQMMAVLDSFGIKTSTFGGIQRFQTHPPTQLSHTSSARTSRAVSGGGGNM